MQHFFENCGTIETINHLKLELADNNRNFGYLEFNDNESDKLTYQRTRGKKGATWMHPYLFVKFAMWLSPTLEVKIIKWIYDNLIEFRLHAGDHYKEMCDAIAQMFYYYYKRAAGPDVFIGEAHIINQHAFGTQQSKYCKIATTYKLDEMNHIWVP